MQPKYQVVWRSKITGFEGRGQPTTYTLAKAWSDQGDKEHPEIEHYVREVK